jgi:hypothetical protein
MYGVFDEGEEVLCQTGDEARRRFYIDQMRLKVGMQYNRTRKRVYKKNLESRKGKTTGIPGYSPGSLRSRRSYSLHRLAHPLPEIAKEIPRPISQAVYLETRSNVVRIDSTRSIKA